MDFRTSPSKRAICGGLCSPRNTFCICSSMVAMWVVSNELARFLEAKARRARMELARVAVAEIAEKIGFDRRAREKRLIHLGVVEARHRAAIEPQRPSGEQEIRALERTV